MTINLNRQPRQTNKWFLNNSSPYLGPGVYDHDSINAPYDSTIAQNVWPFLSGTDRNFQKFPNENPGPGTYVPFSSTTPKVFRNKSNLSRVRLYQRKAPRFNEKNDASPGPGQYRVNKMTKSLSEMKRIKSQKCQKKHKQPIVVPPPVRPAIPSKITQTVVMRRIERAAYSGLGHDIPAPNTYQPKFTLTKKSQKNANINLFKTRRLSPFEATKFIDNSMPSYTNPGPGSYEVSQLHLAGTKASTSLAGQSSFASSNKRFKYQISVSPGPADYGSLNESTNSAKKTKQMAKLGPLSSKSCAALKERAPRLTTHFTLDPHFPFSEATFVDNPGPGKYGKEKGINLRTLILEEESIRYPFNSSSARVLLGTQAQSMAPGPGSYNPLRMGKSSPLNISQNTDLSVSNFQPSQSPFGSSISRFKFSYVQEGKSESPGPGQYQVAVSNLQKSFKETQSKFLNKTNLNDDLKMLEQNQEGLTVQKLRNDKHGFLSKSPRFQAYNGNNPYILELSRSNSMVNKQAEAQQQSPGLLSKDLEYSIKEAENRKSISTFKHQKKLEEYKKENDRTVPFRSTTPRFTEQFTENKSKRDQPGPGAYEVVRPKSQMEHRTITYAVARSPASIMGIKAKPAFGSTQQRFMKNVTLNASNKLGPGHYNSCTNLMGTKKSFNSTISEMH